ncbi:MAG: hypothetical protein IID16_00955 [Candidatus Marinimicrobia bacterium]|nr:hypothetical protein [Candidatus Neomarinimicrobiota bacterium]
MKKHKVKIPEGYEIENTSTTAPPTSITINLKPIKKELPKTWKEFINIKGRFHCNLQTKSNCLPNEFTALYKLTKLRDYYNDKWEPDWTNNQAEYTIHICDNAIQKGSIRNESHVLAFKNPDLRDEFLSNFRDLIETAKPLL